MHRWTGRTATIFVAGALALILLPVATASPALAASRARPATGHDEQAREGDGDLRDGEVLLACGAFTDRGHGAVVRLVYMQLLGRCPDPAGYGYWTARLVGGTSPAVFAAAISDTDEAQGLMVARAYEMMLGRGPDGDGQAYWTARLQGGLTYDRLLAALAAENEFWVKAGATAEGFVERLYERVLQREADPLGLGYWAAQLGAGESRGDVASMFTTQLEPRERLVNTAYLMILGRLPTPAELVAAAEQLGATGNLAGVYAEVIGTPEFRSQAQALLTVGA